jgi:polysaccharide biosynthesis transport protein
MAWPYSFRVILPTMQETSLADYLGPLRRSRLLIAVVTIIAVVTAVVLSLLQSPEYAAKTSLLVEDQSQALAAVGTVASSPNTPAEQSNLVAKTFLTGGVFDRARTDLGTNLTIEQLRRDVSVTPDPSTNLVTVEAHARTGLLAARLANTVAREGARRQNASARAQYAAAARSLRARLRQAGSNQALQLSYQEQIGRLQALSVVSTPVRIASTAGIPSSPVSPKPVRNAVIALILGLFLGVILAFVREAFARSFKEQGEITDLVDLPLMGGVSEEALGHAGLSANGLGPISTLDFEAFRIIRANVEALDADVPPQTILVTSPMPKEGKSTVAASLAYTIAAAGRQTLLVETDLRRPDLAQRLGIAPTPGLADYLQGNAAPEDVPRLVPMSEEEVMGNGQQGPHERLTTIPAGSLPSQPAELLQGERFAHFIVSVKEVWESVVIDSPPLLPVADTLALLPYVDRVLFCVRLGQTHPDQAIAALDALRRHAELPTGLVTTGLQRRDRGYFGYYGYYAGDVARERALFR